MNNKTIAFAAIASLLMVMACLTAVCLTDGDGDEPITVKDETELKTALGQSDVHILLANDIKVTSTVVMDKENVILDGSRPYQLIAGVDMQYAPLLKVTGNNCKIQNICLDSDYKATGVLIQNATGVGLYGAIINQSKTCALTVDMSSVTVLTALKMGNNGTESEVGTFDGDYIHLAWSGSSNIDKCSILFSNAEGKARTEYDRTNVVIDSGDLSKAGVTTDKWRDKFSVKYGDEDLPFSVYGTADGEKILINNGIATVDGVRYASLRDAVKSVADRDITVKLTQSCIGGGFTLPANHKQFVLNLAENEYILADPVGIPGCSDDGFVLGTGDAVSIVNGEITGYDPDTRKLVDTGCNLSLNHVTLDMMMAFSPDPENTYALAVDGAICNLTASNIYAKTTDVENRSYLLDNKATLFIAKEKINVYGDSLITGGSQLEIASDFKQAFGVMHHSSSIYLDDGIIWMEPKSSFGFEVYADGYGTAIQLEFLSAATDCYVIPASISGNAKVIGSFAAEDDPQSDELSGSITVFSPWKSNVPIDLYVVIGEGVGLSVYSPVRAADYIVMKSGSTLTFDGKGCIAYKEKSYLVLMDGCDVNGTEVEGNHVYEVKEGGAFTEQMMIVFMGYEHVNGFRYLGEETDVLMMPISEGTKYIDLSKLSADLDSGYQLSGWEVNGVEHGINDIVPVDGFTVITPMITETANINLMSIFIIAVLGLPTLAIITLNIKD